jgi:hypothetical protein
MTHVPNQADESADEESPTNLPHTDELAAPNTPEIVTNTLAIRILGGSYRNAKIKDAIFEIGDIKKPFDIYAGNLRVQVKCQWYGWQPKNSWIHITLDGDWEIIQNHIGEVSKNFIRPSK